MRTVPWLILICLVGAAVPAKAGCIWIGDHPATIRQEIESADAAVLAKWVSAKRRHPSVVDNDHQGQPGQTTYKVLEVVKDAKETVKNKKEVIVEQYLTGKPRDFVLVVSSDNSKLRWQKPIPVTRGRFDYIKAVAALDGQRDLEFYLDYLEDSDAAVAQDAFLEFEMAPFEDVKLISKKLPRDKLRRWIKAKNTKETRRRLYGEMLGLCGTDEDAEFMAEMIRKQVKDFRAIDGVMSGYLLLKGEEGLKLLEDTKLKADVNAPFPEKYAAMLALEFAWSEVRTIERNRLKESMRLVLQCPEFADLAVRKLARWKDWEVQDQVLALYDRKDYDVPAIKRSIVRYLLSSIKDSKDDAEQNPEKHAAMAKIHLETLRKKDPKTVQQAERFYFD